MRRTDGRQTWWRYPVAHRRHRRHAERGQALVEFAMVVGLFLTLVISLVCVGQLLLANYTVSQAARAAAHQAALAGGAPEAAYTAATQVINAGVGTDTTAATVTVICTRQPCRRYDPITVTVDYAAPFWTPLPPIFTAFTLHAQATRAAERDQQ